MLHMLFSDYDRCSSDDRNLFPCTHCQVFSNFMHKSTEGLSVGYVLLELIGGTFSVLQMLLLAYNFGMFSVCMSL